MTVSENMVFNIVVALAAHFETREKAILKKSVTPRVRMEYIYVNSKMLDAAAEVVGMKYAKEFIMDVGQERGYAKSKIDAFSEACYKKSKQAVKRKIAERLHLLDPAPEISCKSGK